MRNKSLYQSTEEGGAVERKCGDCIYFVRYYTKKENGEYYALDAGQCGSPRTIKKEVNTPACGYWKKNAAAMP